MLSNKDPFDVLERMRTFAIEPQARKVTERVWKIVIREKPFIAASNGWALVAVPGGMVDDIALNGLSSLSTANRDGKVFADYFGADFHVDRFSLPLKELRAWCGAPIFRKCDACGQTMTKTARHGIIGRDRVIDRNLIAMAIDFGDPDGMVDIGATGDNVISPIVFRHAHFLAVVMPMREEITGEMPRIGRAS